MELKVFESPGQEWDEFASQYTDLIFYQSLWSEVLKKGLGGQPLYFYLKEGGRIVAGLPGVLLDFKIIKILYASIPYGNMIGEPSYFQTFMEMMEGMFRERGIGQVRISDAPFLSPYAPPSFEAILGKCTLLDLKGFDRERLLESHKKYVRRDVRRAQRSGIVIRAGNSAEDAKIFYKLYQSSMERNLAMTKYPPKWFDAVYGEMVERHLGVFLFAELDAEAVAGAVLIESKTGTHYLHNGSLPGSLKLCPNELLIHQAIEGAIEIGQTFFDFMGSDPKDLPLIKFKEKWGSRSLDVRTYVKDYLPFRCKTWELGKKWAGSKLGSRLIRMIRH